MNQFSTVGELMDLLDKLPKDMPLYICGAVGHYYELPGGKAVCLDCEGLEGQE